MTDAWGFAQELVRTRERAPLLERILQGAIELLGGERGFLILEEAPPEPEAAGALTIRCARNIDCERLSDPAQHISRTLVERVLREREGRVVANAAGDPSLRQQPSVKQLQLRSLVCAPLRIAGQVRGVIYVDNRSLERAFDAGDLATLENLAVTAGIVLESLEDKARIEALTRGLSKRKDDLECELSALREAVRAGGVSPLLPELVGESPVMSRLAGVLRQVASSGEAVLIQGESGTGKELVARAIHAGGTRRGPFLAINCAAIPDELLESELFGHRRGSWTGATADRDGFFRAAHGGTLFLDEVGETSPAMQRKLLRVLQEGEVRPLGAEQTHAVDVRIVAATNRELRAEVAAGRFREDLYYRLAVLTVDVPPLRERGEDVPLLARHFLAGCVERTGRPPRTFTEGALRALSDHGWPGNVRELDHAIRRAHALAGGNKTLTERDFEVQAARAEVAPAGEVRSLRDVEREQIELALARCGGNVTEAAQRLGIDRATLYRKLKKLRAD